MTVTVPSFNPILFEGLSTDTKPDTWAAPGQPLQATPARSNFIETDTGDEYHYSGSAWVKHKDNGSIYSVDLDHRLEIPKGGIPGSSGVNKFGRNTNVASGATEEIWDGSASYVFPATALMTSISQTTDQTAMRGATIEVEGLDASWDAVTQNAVLDGTLTTNVVTLTTPLIRCFRMRVLADVVSTSPIRVHNAGETQDYAIIDTGNNQTLMAVYTVPNGKTAFMTCYYAHHNPATNQDPTSNPVTLWFRDNDNGYEAQIKNVVGLPNAGGFQHFFDPYIKITQKSDVFIKASPVGKAADVSAGFDLVLVDN